MKNDLTQTSTPYKAYKSLLVQNIINSFEKSHYQEAKKDLQRCFSLENYQGNKSEMSVLYNLCVSIIHYKKNEIKKLFTCIDESFLKLNDSNLEKISATFTQETYSYNLIKRIILKEVVLKKASLIQGLNIEDIISNEKSIWFKNKHNFFIFLNIAYSLLMLQKNPVINVIYKNSFINWFDKFRDQICISCEICTSKSIKSILFEIEILKNSITKSTSTIVINNDENLNTKLGSFNKSIKASNPNIIDLSNDKDSTNSPQKIFQSKSNSNTRDNTTSKFIKKNQSSIINLKENKIISTQIIPSKSLIKKTSSVSKINEKDNALFYKIKSNLMKGNKPSLLKSECKIIFIYHYKANNNTISDVNFSSTIPINFKNTLRISSPVPVLNLKGVLNNQTENTQTPQKESKRQKKEKDTDKEDQIKMKINSIRNLFKQMDSYIKDFEKESNDAKCMIDNVLNKIF